MTKGADSENYLVLSGVRSGLKREFEFALKVQSEICGSYGRTRSRKVDDGGIESSESRSNKRIKKDAKVKNGRGRKNKGWEEPVRIVDDAADLMSEEEAKSDVVDLEEPKSDGNGEMKDSVGENSEAGGFQKEKEIKDVISEPMCEDDIEKGRVEESLLNSDEIEKTRDKSLKMDIEEKEMDREKASTEAVKGYDCEVGILKEGKSKKEFMNSEVDKSGIDAINGSVKVYLRRKREKQVGNEEGSSKKAPITGVVDGGKAEIAFEEKSPQRFTRSSLKQTVEPEVKCGDSDVEQDGDFRSRKDGSVKCVDPLSKPEMNSSISFPRNVQIKLKDLLDSGILEGKSVKYRRHSKGSKGSRSGVNELQGVIRGSGILCSCSDCKGVDVVVPTMFELHARSANKRPADYIHLENGNTLRDVMNVWKENPLSSLEEALRIAIGPSMKKSKFCFSCRGSITKGACKKTTILCNSCLEQKEPQVNCTEEADTSEKSPKPTLMTKSSYSGTKMGSSLKKLLGKVTRKDLRMHKLVFEEHGLPEGTELAYFVGGKKYLVGYKKGSGILCTCCNSEVSPSLFEAHAGWVRRRKPFQHIYTSNGVSLHELSISLSKELRISTSENDDLCSICLDGGDLVCCDTCPRAFHKECVLLPKVPTGTWYCRYCQNTFQKEKYVEHNANAVAAGRVEGVDPIEQITKRCIRIVKRPDIENPSVCVLCRGHNFSKSGFGPLTVILCDQCEKEYHVGCLREHNIADLKELPKGQWFCCQGCNVIHSALHQLVVRGEEKLPNSSLTGIKKNHEEVDSESETNLDVRWRVLSGKMSSLDDTRVLLSKAVAIFHESFDPISESGSAKGDLIPAMVYGRTVKGQDFGGMYCALLTVNEVVVSAGIFRIFGQEVAELPLVATSSEAQGQGYFQCLFSCIEKLLGFLKVENLVLPAADEAESIWTKKFGFCKMPPDEVNKYKREYEMMIFQGTSMLWKPVPGIVLKSEVKKPVD